MPKVTSYVHPDMHRQCIADKDAEIARLTAELAAARAVPTEVEAAVTEAVDGAEEAGRCSALGHAYLITKAPFWTVPRLKAAIARAISDATAGAHSDLAVAVHGLGEVTRAYHVANDAIGEVCRLVGAESTPGAADVAGNDASWKRDAVAKVRALVEASQPATVGGLLATAPVARPISEWHEDYGNALWWRFPIDEPPYSGSPLDDDWPGYHTHWTPIVIPGDPASRGPIEEG